MDRADYEADGCACPLSPICQLIEEHGGECDPRTEVERFKALHLHLDVLEAEGGDVDGPELFAMVEAGAAASMRHALAGGRTR